MSVFNPANALAVFPFAVFLFALGVHVDSAPVLLSLVPGADVLSSIWPLESPLTLLHVVDVLADIAPSIGPGKGAVAFHFVVAPLSGEDSAVGPLIDPRSVDVVVIKLSCVGAVVSPCEFSFTMLLALEVLALIRGAIGPPLNTEAVLLVL